MKGTTQTLDKKPNLIFNSPYLKPFNRLNQVVT